MNSPLPIVAVLDELPAHKIEPANEKAAVDVTPHYCECDFGECRTDLLPMLYEMSRIAAENEGLENILKILLQLMRRHMKVLRGMISLFDAGTGKIFIHDSFGLTDEEAARG